MNFTINNELNDFNHEEFVDLFKQITDYLVLKLNLKKDRFFECSFVSLEEIHSINKEYRNKDYATDVISFALDDAGLITPLLGEMYICVEKAKMQANEYNHSFNREICFLFTHGLLHLLGYDHQTKEQEEEMFSLQENVLKNIGVTR